RLPKTGRPRRLPGHRQRPELPDAGATILTGPGGSAVSKTLELPDELYERLADAAATSGATPVEWLERHIPKPNGRTAQPQATKTLRERIEGIIGSVASGGRGRLCENTEEDRTR